jgi:hypothetical protein
MTRALLSTKEGVLSFQRSKAVLKSSRCLRVTTVRILPLAKDEFLELIRIHSHNMLTNSSPSRLIGYSCENSC